MVCPKLESLADMGTLLRVLSFQHILLKMEKLIKYGWTIFNMENITPADKQEEYVLENKDYLLITAIKELTQAINRQTGARK